ncbi:Fic family protein [Propionimicrobium sp. PCR01-08-3]|uniref:Fic family protein n=1 Tax=Propionimicrobium sp. PCR01-08-3 TaxID=3052086 RepID=UPI00255CD376|nr:Fic family protein [Propionimicrobium sp. PCR01-08-3]WIY82618.1 Fic family protein [Propionimicrobium sp. PCR01-08-3]
MTDEYAIDASQFARTLREQRQLKLPGGLYHLTQIEMAFNSNRIEGSRLSKDQTRFIYETRTVIGDALVDDVLETSNHFRAFDIVIDHVGEPLTSGFVKELHRILKTGTQDATKDWFAVGDWKKLPNEVGGNPTTPPEQVDTEISRLLAEVPKQMTFAQICDFHVRFETIHPFQDGNGRVGRLILFGQCLSNDIMPFVVSDDEKAFYYRGLQEYSHEPGYLRDTFRHFQDQYYTRFHSFVPAKNT